MKIIYFSWLKETLGTSEENVMPPASIKNIDNLIKWLSAKSIKHKKVFLKSKNNVFYAGTASSQGGIYYTEDFID